MTRLEDRTVLAQEELPEVECPTCGETVVLGEDGKGYVGIHCDRSMSVRPQAYIASVLKLTPKNIDSAIEANVSEEDAKKLKEDDELKGAPKSEKQEADKYGYAYGKQDKQVGKQQGKQIGKPKGAFGSISDEEEVEIDEL